jgi:membrane-bound lytic murein transglycosylase B
VTPVKPSDLFETQRPEPAGTLHRYYRTAERRFGVDWEVLAAINMIETRFGRIKSNSIAGAQGPMQFIESTWEAYGMGGDVHDPHDAIMGAANYLRASGAPDDYSRSLFAYNHSSSYVRAISSYFREIMRDPRNYYAYYNWQVFMVTTKGDIQLTGPGKDV